MTKSPLHQYIVTPEMMKPIQTLTGKQLHITVDTDICGSLTRFLHKYEGVITKFIKDNKASAYAVKASTIPQTNNTNNSVLVVIINILA